MTLYWVEVHETDKQGERTGLVPIEESSPEEAYFAVGTYLRFKKEDIQWGPWEGSGWLGRVWHATGNVYVENAGEYTLVRRRGA